MLIPMNMRKNCALFVKKQEINVYVGMDKDVEMISHFKFAELE